MRDTASALFDQAFLNTPLWDLRQVRKDRIQRQLDEQALTAWLAAGRPIPPPDLVKRTTLADFGRAFSLTTLVETGTFLGGTMHALRNDFRTLYSIELSPELAARARRRFRSIPQVHILEGDSGKLLAELLDQTTVPCLFWLDGHYSGGVTAKASLDTPILQELETIFSYPVKEHVILIDDARLFNGTDDYPTLDQLRNLIAARRPHYDFSVVNDCIRAHPPRQVPLTY